MIIDEKVMEELGMNVYLVVFCGFENFVYLFVIEFKNYLNFDVKLIVLVGKGLIFDLGGIFIKLFEVMDEMKYDMGGVVLVYGIMKVLVEMNLLLNVIGVLVGCENMLDGNVYCFGDIFIMMNGLMVEVLNIDVEGCLVLCDMFIYVECFDFELVIDVVILIGVCMIVLGVYNSGLMFIYNNFVYDLFNVVEEVDDKVWCLLLGEEY